MVADTRRYSYREIWERAQGLAHSLWQLGLRPGDLIGLWMLNGPEWPIGIFANARIGAISFGINTRLRAQEIAYLLAHSKAKALVVGHRPGGIDFVDLAYSLIPELRGTEGTLRSARFPDLRFVICTGAEPWPGMLGWPDLARPVDSLAVSLPQPDPRSIALLQYTSGSTAEPKGALLTHASVTGNALGFAERLGIGPEDRHFVGNPFFHGGGLIQGMLAAVATRGTVVTMEHYEAGAALALLERERCTCRLGSEVMYRREMAHPDFPQRDLSALTKGTCMGVPEVIRQAHDRMGMHQIISQYSITEASGNVSTPLRTDPLEIRATTVGRPLAGVEVRVIHPESGRALEPGQAGEILVRGWNVMKRYYRDPETTARTIDADGWLHTGDFGRLDATGNLVFLGRLKDVVRVGGENVSAAEVEGFLLGHPAVKLVQVVAAPDPDLGEVPVAFVELQPGALCSGAELAAFCEERLARFKIPRAFEIVTEWPTTGSGKIRKVELRDRAALLRRTPGTESKR